MALTAGIDVGTNSVKMCLLEYFNGEVQVLSKGREKIRSRLLNNVVSEFVRHGGISEEQLDYVATTGNKEKLELESGHFYSMTAHARGAVFLNRDVKTVVDVGAFHTRVMRIDDKGRVLTHMMTGQCAAGTGQFLENITRYLGISIDEVALLSLSSKDPQRISSICAVLSETDVINMVAKGVQIGDIVKGIHLTLSDRVLKMVSRIKAESPVMVTGGMGADGGLVATLKENVGEKNMRYDIVSDSDAAYAGAIGAGILGGYRYEKIYDSA